MKWLIISVLRFCRLSGKRYFCADMIREMLDLMMPRECLVCGRRLGAKERAHNPMADQFNALLEQMRQAETEEGDVGRVDEAEWGTDNDTGARERMEYARACALMFYHHENPFKHIPKALKYDGNIKAGRYYATMLGRKMAESGNWGDVDLVIPVPLHWFRRYRRGYNQAEVIAKAVARELGARFRSDILCRKHRTKSQTKLDAAARLRNVQGVFGVKKRCAATHVLIIDDTFTTGATLCACYFAVRQAFGPNVRISVATLAVVQA